MLATLLAAGVCAAQAPKSQRLAPREFGDRLGRNAAGLFYFAGHGLQVRGRNYLLPVDADIASEDEVAFAALDLGAVIEKMDTARNPTNLVILDACRNNPFAGRFQLSARGLAALDATTQGKLLLHERIELLSSAVQ